MHLPGQRGFVFSLYGCPDRLEELKALVEVMRRTNVANGFDPGPPAVADSLALIEYLATLGWPVVSYPPDEPRMQIRGGTSVMSNEDEQTMRIFDRAGVFSAVQLGEWGYHFHRLTRDEGWWKAALGDEFDAKVKRFIKPKEFRGYDSMPASRRECYDQVRDYFLWHRQAKRNRLISITGNSHYEAYAAEWGARVVGVEVGENIPFTQSKFAFARGASRQWNVPWSVQVSPWFGDAVTTRGELDTSVTPATGLDAGHSLSLYLRLWRHAWFAGAAMVTPENSINSFFETGGSPWTLNRHGEAAGAAHRFMRDHDRGYPYTPLLIVLDRLAGYCPYQGRTWGVLPLTAGDQEIYDLLETQLFSSPARLQVPGDPPNPERNYLQPTRYGELADVFLSTAPGAIMKHYPVILLVGDVDFPAAFVDELFTAAEAGSRILLHPRHVQAMRPGDLHRLREAGSIEVLAAEINPDTGRPAAVAPQRLREIEREHLPIGVEGDPVQYQINRNRSGWVIELINNDGVVKEGRKPAVVHPSVIARVQLAPRIEYRQAREWMTATDLGSGGQLEIAVPPGETRYVEFIVSE